MRGNITDNSGAGGGIYCSNSNPIIMKSLEELVELTATESQIISDSERGHHAKLHVECDTILDYTHRARVAQRLFCGL